MLTRLESAGLIAPHAVEPGKGPRRQLYTSTPAGHRSISSWLDTPVEHIRDVRSRLLLKLALRDRRGLDTVDLVRRQRQVLTPIARAIEGTSEVADVGFDATLSAWRRANTRATLAFLDELATHDA